MDSLEFHENIIAASAQCFMTFRGIWAGFEFDRQPLLAGPLKYVVVGKSQKAHIGPVEIHYNSPKESPAIVAQIYKETRICYEL